jgi:RNA polymerase sigma factor (TIGR02999 family)
VADLTQLLIRAGGGDGLSRERLLALVYDDLRRLAAAKMRHESAGHTLQATALVHEVYVRLLADNHQAWENRHHFYAAAGEAMRRILVDWARGKGRLKRGGRSPHAALPDDVPEVHPATDPAQVLAVHEALEKLRQMDPRLCDIVNLRIFVGMTVAQTAMALGVTSRTINREWVVAKAFLRQELNLDPDTTFLVPGDVAH